MILSLSLRLPPKPPPAAQSRNGYSQLRRVSAVFSDSSTAVVFVVRSQKLLKFENNRFENNRFENDRFENDYGHTGLA